MINLPGDFLDRMERLLGNDYSDFLKSYEKSRQYGMRRNPLKAGKEAFEKMEFGLRKVPWADEGYYYDNDTKPGKNPYHEAGAYYIQEPSAMVVAELLDVKPGEKVLDLCAAPGGKSTQIAGKMQGKGLLVSNEVNYGRVKILSRNIERMGISNAVVLNEDTGSLAEKFPLFFDKILVDAPCSGEGMFRKDENARSEWSINNVEKCAQRQLMILNDAASMVRVGGIMVYSTCTFSPEENEQVIAGFLKEHSEFELSDCNFYQGFDNGHSEWTDGADVSKAIRLWPHKIAGEGHFAAKLVKKDGDSIHYETDGNYCKILDLSMYKEFVSDFLKSSPADGNFVLFGEQLYCIPKEMISLKGIKVIRPGLHIGVNKKNRFEPAHAFAAALKPSEAANVKVLDISMATEYINGQTIDDDKLKGWTLMCVEGPCPDCPDCYSVGWGKASNGVIKNHYPKGIRIAVM